MWLTPLCMYLGLITFEPEGADAERYAGAFPLIPLFARSNYTPKLDTATAKQFERIPFVELLWATTVLTLRATGELENDVQHGLGV